MTKKDVKSLLDLKDKIEHYAHSYYNLNISLISDSEYDKLVAEYNNILQYAIESGIIKHKEDYELKVGAYPNSPLSKVKHINKMFSLDNVFNFEELTGFMKKIKNFLNINTINHKSFNTNLDRMDFGIPINFSLEPKIDGLAFCAVYDHNGCLKYVSTRGNGAIGEDITNNMLTIADFPRKININTYLLIASKAAPNKLIDEHTRCNIDMNEKNNQLIDTKSTADTVNPNDSSLNTFKKNLSTIEVRGEIFITKNDFANLNLVQKNNGLEPFANARNAASGSIRQLNHKISQSRPLKYIAYEIFFNQHEDNNGVNTPQHELLYSHNQVNYSNISQNSYPSMIPKYNALSSASESYRDNLYYGNSQFKSIELLKSLGFSVFHNNELVQIDLYNMDSIYKIQKVYEKLLSFRNNIEYEVDGVVVKIDDLNLQKRLGHTNKAPRYSVAYKFPSQSNETKIIDVEYQVGRTGVITPVAILEPVLLSGATVSKATLHNFCDIKRKDIMIGDTVHLIRSGDVIPKILSVNLNLRNHNCKQIEIIKKCPSCNSLLSFDGTFLRCENNKCESIILQRLVHFVEALEIDTLGVKHITSLYNAGIINNLTDVFSIKEKKADILNLPRMGSKLLENIIKNIENSRTVSLDRFLFSLGIPNIGMNNAKLLAAAFKNIETFITKAEILDFNLLKIDGIGENITMNIRDYCNSNIDILKKLSEIMKILPVNDTQGILSNMSFVFTGSLSISRKEAKVLVEKKGGTVKNSVSDGVILVMGLNGGKKTLDAGKKDVRVINEVEFFNLIQE